LDLEGHGLDGCAFEYAALADHGVEKVLTGLTPRKTPSEAVVKSTEFIKESVDITGGKLKRRDGEHLAFGSLCR